MNKVFIKKNILDTDLQKYLQVASVSIIIAFGYLTGVVIAALTHQINWQDFIDVRILSILSVFILGFSFFFFINAIIKIKRITKAIRDLDNFID